jgi:uncharacterized surface protein with fasciclin (FAS1) repeats
MNKICFFFIFFLFLSTNVYSKNVIDIIKEDPELTEFYSYLEKTGIKKILEKKLPWNWTIFAPNNNAFNSIPSRVREEILSDQIFSKVLIMDHILTGQKTSLDIGEEVSNEVTVSNKPIQIYKRGSLFVKDMIVVKENKAAKNGVVHQINCVMYVQQSQDDNRLTKKQKEDFPITSCCMRTDNEINSWIKSTNL